MNSERDDFQIKLTMMAKPEGNRDELLQRAAECRKSGLFVAARKLEKTTGKRTDDVRLVSFKCELKRYNAALKKYDDGKTDERPDCAVPALPILRRFFLEGTTVAKLSDIMQYNPRALSIVRDELSGWLLS
ncbi:hypothetical protein [Shimia thalassica]|uniref:hypothetical protein n=1 Tax=Shimia thalassica TaxID=1715693 RepID=UPI0026E18DC6|nr:hypothetical protein [Shimia thalassica]MDO6483559.1 hypothetical protein [Shimia thalassica]